MCVCTDISLKSPSDRFRTHKETEALSAQTFRFLFQDARAQKAQTTGMIRSAQDEIRTHTPKTGTTPSK